MNNPYLEQLIADFSTERITRFFRNKSSKFAPQKENLDEYNDNSFKEGIKLGEIKFDETEELIVCAFLCENPLSERSGKKAQYEKAKKILKERISDAGIFVFYDKNGNFRFSLIYANYLGKQRDWSTFKRFTYFVSKEFTNKTFLKRIGECDFTSLETIKDAFSVEKVTKEFYENISHWYFWTVKNCTFPKDAEAEENGRNISVIRLITRMIFVWFMRERGLIPRELFTQDAINKLLRDSSDYSSSYYQAILQNLFFATLSTKQEEREFRSEIRGNKGFNPDHGNQYVYRFQDYFTDPERLRTLFTDIPFLNGGLFDCLDDSQKGIYIDGFSETKKNQAAVPNFLFFGRETKVDLSGDLGPQQKVSTVNGLLNILSEFNFTIDENTADDKDVALDPELLGRVFENLLASFNPETSSTARKATGSYYTPREIVDYMVDESLKGYLQTHLMNVEKIDEKLSLLFSHETEENPFTQGESKQIVSLIESVRVVDPAVGSGAFPMGILNRLVFMLHKVDPKNDYWKQEQLNAAEQIPDPRIRKETKNRIEAYFTKNDNYGRKLFLIQKCIYGVDIQQIAVEIAKLRFFISLLVDEDIDKDKPNWGIEPLPNLDFKIMQGNSLISEFLGVNFEIKKESSTGQAGFDFQDERSRLIKQFESKKIEYQNESDKSRKGKLLQEIDDVIIEMFELIVKQQKESYFSSIESIKRKYSILPNREEREEIIRKETEKINARYSFDLKSAEKQLRDYTGKMKTRPFFPWQLYFAEVFTEKKGFDIIITNPPYLGQKGNKEKFQEIAKTKFGKEFHQRRMDMFYFFIHLALNLAHEKSQIAFITTNYYITATYADKLRKDIYLRATIRDLINFNELKIFESALGQHNMISIFEKGKYNSVEANTAVTKRTGFGTNSILKSILGKIDQLTDYKQIKQVDIYQGEQLYINLLGSNTSLTTEDPKAKILSKISSENQTLGTICNVFQGIVTGADKVSPKYIKKYSLRMKPGEGIFVLSDDELMHLNLNNKELRYIRPWFKNSDISRYLCSMNNNQYLIYRSSKHTENDIPNIKKHLDKFKLVLINRNVRAGEVTLLQYDDFVNGKGHIDYVMIASAMKAGNFYALSYARDEELFNGPKIVSPQRSYQNTFSYNDVPWYASADVYYITSKDNSIDLKYILALLNSSLYYFWLYYRGKRKGEMLELYQKPLSEIPIKKILYTEQKPFIEIVDQILVLANSDDYLKNNGKQILVKKYEQQIDKMVYELYGLMDEEIAVVEKSANHDQNVSPEEVQGPNEQL